MNRTLIIIAVVLVVLLIAAGVYVLRPASTPSSPQQQTTNTNPTNTYTVQPSTQSNSQSSAQSNAQSTQAVQAAVQNAMLSYSFDHIQLHQTAIAGQFALQAWSGDSMGGEALLRFNSSKNQWDVLTDGGGAWTVADLVSVGVATDTATTLLAGMPK